MTVGQRLWSTAVVFSGWTWASSYLVVFIRADHVLIGNTRGDSSIFKYDLTTGSIDTFINGTEYGLQSPDHIALKDGYYYISTGNDLNTSAIARWPVDRNNNNNNDGNTGGDNWELLAFATGGGLHRPYGFAFHEQLLYVASFQTDQILTYDACTGDYVGVFAQGNATAEGLCNGPNQMDIYKDKLYLTTQGSYVDGNGTLQYAFASQVVVYDLTTAEGQVFISQPDPDPNGLGYVSLLGIHIGCDDESVLEDDCTVYTTDFAGGLRLYAFQNTSVPVALLSTTYASDASTGSLSLGGNGTVYIPAFSSDTNGVLIKAVVVVPDEMSTTTEVLFESADDLQRPIGVLFVRDDDPQLLMDPTSTCDEPVKDDSPKPESGVSSQYTGMILPLLFLATALAYFTT